MKTGFLFCAFAASVLGGCTVYAPMQPTVSGIRAVGEAELGASIQGSGRVEASAVVSPAPGFLLAGAGTYRPRIAGGNTYFATRQWEAAAGAYVPLGPRWVVSGLGGYGYARTERIWSEVLGYSPELSARYRKGFGQFNLHCGTPHVGAGLVYRASRLDFDELSFNLYSGGAPLDMTRMWRHELLVYVRPVVSSKPDGRWTTLLQSSVGLSLSSTKRADEDVPNQFEYNRNLGVVVLASLGLTVARKARQPPAAAPR